MNVTCSFSLWIRVHIKIHNFRKLNITFLFVFRHPEYADIPLSHTISGSFSYVPPNVQFLAGVVVKICGRVKSEELL